MCKILVIPFIPAENRHKVEPLLRALAKPMTRADDDGLGFAMVSERGRMYGARWADTKKFLDYTLPESDYKEKLARWEREQSDWAAAQSAATGLGTVLISPAAKSAPEKSPPPEPHFYNFGEPFEENELPCSLILHSRMATSPKGLINAHPMWHPEHKIAMIHNGVITNSFGFVNEISTLDSEEILFEYQRANVNEKLENIQKVADALTGYYACAAYQRDNAGAWVLDFFRDNAAQMDAFFVKELGAVVFVTAGRIVREACQELKWSAPLEYAHVMGEVLVRFNPMTGDVLGVSHFQKRNWQGKFSQYGYTENGYNSSFDNANWGYLQDDWKKGQKRKQKKRRAG